MAAPRRNGNGATDYQLNGLSQALRDVLTKVEALTAKVDAHDRSAELHARDNQRLLSRLCEIAEKSEETQDRIAAALERAMSMPPWASVVLKVLLGLTLVVLTLVLGKEGVSAFLGLFH